MCRLISFCAGRSALAGLPLFSLLLSLCLVCFLIFPERVIGEPFHAKVRERFVTMNQPAECPFLLFLKTVQVIRIAEQPINYSPTPFEIILVIQSEVRNRHCLRLLWSKCDEVISCY